MSAAEDLTDHLLTLGPDLADDETRERWVVENDDMAGWAFRKIARAETERSRIRQDAAAEIARIEAWAADAERTVDHDVQFFTGKLIEYRRMLEDRDPDLPKTYKTPLGSIARRAGRSKVNVINEAAFVEWAQEALPDALTMKPRVSALSDFADMSGHLIDPVSGEKVPGVERVTSPDRYEVRPADATPGPF